jgi:hypothetical protein
MKQLLNLYDSWPNPVGAEKYRAKLASYETAKKEAAKTEATD